MISNVFLTALFTLPFMFINSVSAYIGLTDVVPDSDTISGLYTRVWQWDNGEPLSDDEWREGQPNGRGRFTKRLAPITGVVMDTEP